MSNKTRSAARPVLAQPEMQKRRSPLVSIPPFGRGFSRHGGLSSDDFSWLSVCSARGLAPALLNIGSMSPPGYPSAWLRPRRARFCFARQDHCSSTQFGGLNFRFGRMRLESGPPNT
jgi:hypothetical protein